MNKTLPIAPLLLAGCAAAQPPAQRPAADSPSASQQFDVHDFDFLDGEWDVHNRRLKHRGVASAEWDEFPGFIRSSLYLGGVANVDQFDLPALGFSGLTLRAFNQKTKRWSIYWVNSRIGVLDPGVEGGFVGDRGEFYGVDDDGGRAVRVRYIWNKLGPDKATWEQAFSYDGATWETNWMSTLTRRAPAARPSP